MNIGARIRELRKGKKMSADKLASEVNTTQQTISNYERNESEPGYEMLENICKAIGITMAEFFTDEEVYNQAADKYIRDLIVRYEKTTGKEKAADILRSMTLEEQRAHARKHVKAGHVTESGVEYELFSIEETIEQFKSLPAEAQEALAKVIRLFASNKR